MCVLCVKVLSPCLQVCVVPKISHPPQSSKLMPFETYVCFFEKTEQGWKFEIPQIFDFEKSGFFIGGRANHRFHELIRFRWLFWVKCICEAPKNLATINFLAHCIFLQGLWILDQLMYLKEGQILGLDFPKFGQIFASVWGFNFWVCFIRKVHWETILKSTYRYSRTFRPVKTEISHTCTCLMFFLRIGEGN